jgi:hypothetical protein
MVGLFVSKSRFQNSSCLRGLMVLALMLLLALPTLSYGCRIGTTSGEENPSGPGSMIQVLGHSIEGNWLIIKYDIEYPGMTKVKLYNGNRELLWRSQYVDDTIGTHQLVLKASALDPGNYVFEFDYKNQIRSYPISM